MDKTLGQIAHETGERVGGWLRRWDLMAPSQKAEWEAIAAAVAAAVKEEDARICIDYANRLAGISHHDHPPADEAAVDCADDIRASIKEVK